MNHTPTPVAVVRSALVIGLALGLASSVRAQCVELANPPTPLSSLGCANYAGESGGLYGSGRNARPPEHLQHVSDVAASVQPIAGRVVVVSIGMSNTSQEWKPFAAAFTSRSDVRSELRLVDGAWGGHPIECFRSASAPGNPAYCAGETQAPSGNGWDNLDARLGFQGLAPSDVQVAWLKHAILGPSGDFETSVSALEQALVDTLRAARARYPNLRLVYLSSRTHAFTTMSGSPEPYAYESAFAVRRVILRQLAHDPVLNDDGLLGSVEAPTLTWGPYLWAQGTRDDGYAWTSAHVRSDDCTHPSALGITTVADELALFFTSDETASTFILAPGAVPATGRVLPSFTCPGGASDAGIDGGASVDAGLDAAAPDAGATPVDAGDPSTPDAASTDVRRAARGGCALGRMQTTNGADGALAWVGPLALCLGAARRRARPTAAPRRPSRSLRPRRRRPLFGR